MENKIVKMFNKIKDILKKRKLLVVVVLLFFAVNIFTVTNA